MDPCVSSSAGHKEHYLLLGTRKKKRGQIATSARADTRRDSHTQREATKRHPPRLNSVLEQALVTTAVGEAYC